VLGTVAGHIMGTAGYMAPEQIQGDGRLLLFQGEGPGEPGIYLMNLDGDPEVRPIVATGANESNGSLSPDGRFATYQSNESGNAREIATNRQWPISTGVGLFPTWSPRGDRDASAAARGGQLAARAGRAGADRALIGGRTPRPLLACRAPSYTGGGEHPGFTPRGNPAPGSARRGL